jgi:polysaccharide export outer membrane protein
MKPKLLRAIPLFLLCLICLAASPLWGQNSSRGGAAKPPENSTYKIQPNDHLEIFIYDQPDLSRKDLVVQPDGWISIPLVQDVLAAGKTMSQLKAEIEKRLTEFKEVNNVTVMLNAVLSYRVYVLGKVAKSGALMSEKPINVLQAITLAGGFADYAKKQDITITHTALDAQGNPHYTTVLFRYEDVIKPGGDAASQNIMLQADDVINVP